MMNSGSTTATSPPHPAPLITDHRDTDNNPSSNGSPSSPTDANKVPSYVNLARCVSGYSSFTSYTSPARREYSPARRDFSPIGRPAATSSNQRHHRDTSLSRLDKPLSPCREHNYTLTSHDNVILSSHDNENFVKNSSFDTRGRHHLDNRENLSPGSGSQTVGGQGGDQQGSRRVGRTSTGGGLFNVMAEQSPTKPSRLGLLGDSGSTTTTSSGFFTSPSSRSSRFTSNSISSRTSPPSGLPLSPPSSLLSNNGGSGGGGGLNSTALVVDVNRLRNGFQTRSGETRQQNGGGLSGVGFGSNGSPAAGGAPLADVVDSDIRRRVELLEKASHRNLDVNINKTPVSESRYARSGTVTGAGTDNVSGLHHPGASRGIAHQSLNYHPFGGGNNYHKENGGGGKAHHLMSLQERGLSPGKNGNSYAVGGGGGKEIITLDDSPPGANGREDKVSPIPVMKLLNPEFRAMLGKTTKISPNKQFACGAGGDLSSPHAVARVDSSLRENGRQPGSVVAPGKPVGSNGVPPVGVVSKPVPTNGGLASDVRNNNETNATPPSRAVNLNNSFSKTSRVANGDNHERIGNNKDVVNVNVIVNNTRNLNSTRKIINTDRHLDDDTLTESDRNEDDRLNSRNNNIRMSSPSRDSYARDQHNMIIVNNLDRDTETLNNKNRMSNGGFNSRILNEGEEDSLNNEGQVSRIRNDLFKTGDADNAPLGRPGENSTRSSGEKTILDSSLNGKTCTAVVNSNQTSVNAATAKQENDAVSPKIVTKEVLVKQINTSSSNVSGSYSKESHSVSHSIAFNSNEKLFNATENNANNIRKSLLENDTLMNDDISRIENSTRVEIASKDLQIDDDLNSNAMKNELSKDIPEITNSEHAATAKDSNTAHSKEERQPRNDQNHQQLYKTNSEVEEFKTDKTSSDLLPTRNDVKDMTENGMDDDAVNGNIVQESSRKVLSPAKDMTRSFIEAEREFVSSTNVNKSEEDNQKVDIKEGGDLLKDSENEEILDSQKVDVKGEAPKDSKNTDLLVDLKEDGLKVFANIPSTKTDDDDSIKKEIEDSPNNTNLALKNEFVLENNSNQSQDATDFIVNREDITVKDISKKSDKGIESLTKTSSSTIKESVQLGEDSSSNTSCSSSTVKDGDYYKQLLSTDRKILSQFLDTFETVLREHQMAAASKESSENPCDTSSEDTVDQAAPSSVSPIGSDLEGQILLTIGQCKLLLNKKFPFFEKNCEKSLRQAAGDVTVTSAGTEELLILNEDLTGLWDTICIQIDEVRGKFEMLTKLKQNNWVPESGPKIDSLKSGTSKRSSLGNSNSAGNKPLSRTIKSTSSLPKPRSAAVSAKSEERKKFLEEKRKAMLEQKRQGLKREEVEVVLVEGGEIGGNVQST
uniref:Uncharacterized protein n=1 Tax=Cacopsylla melanoneura TaxID=428564 RepID=A0A8D8R1P0_9HEMI